MPMLFVKVVEKQENNEATQKLLDGPDPHNIVDVYKIEVPDGIPENLLAKIAEGLLFRAGWISGDVQYKVWIE